MESVEKRTSLGYAKHPWMFKGSALYQLHLVKAETARAFIPKDFKLVEAFGYTLGGFFLANYEESPAGKFNELVVIAGIIWNPPTSCAWAAKVLVNSDEACIHGRKEIGLPSKFARFKRSAISMPKKRGPFGELLSKVGIHGHDRNHLDVQVKEMTEDRKALISICNISLETSALAPPQVDSKWIGPKLKMSLPSFSGLTEYNPHLLKYSCDVESRVRVVSPAKVFVPSPQLNGDGEEKTSTSKHRATLNEASEEDYKEEYKRKLCLSILKSKPILALEFNSLNMKVEAPTIIQ